MAWTTSDRVMRYRRRSSAVDVLVETIDGWRRHVTGRNAAVLTYYGFLSIFPLFLVASTILGLLLEDNEELRQDILDSAIAQIPVIGREIASNSGTIGGGIWGLVVGLALALWAATKAFVGVQNAFDDAWDVSLDHRGNPAVKRGKALLGIAFIGTSLVATVALAAVAAAADLPAGGRVLIVVGTLAINVVVLAAMYRFLSAFDVSWSMVWPGAILGGFGFTTLQVLGATIVNRFLRNAGDTSGVFATVFALLAWISLHATISLVGIELNAALQRRRAAREATFGWLEETAETSGRDDASPVD
jgi:membrane protein